MLKTTISDYSFIYVFKFTADNDYTIKHGYVKCYSVNNIIVIVDNSLDLT